VRLLEIAAVALWRVFAAPPIAARTSAKGFHAETTADRAAAL
jgi:hypothetical protein